jgi:hypothetical protein
MTLKELKNWINHLPEEFDEYPVMNGKVGKLDEQYHYRIDSPITTLMVDEENKEIIVMYDDQEDFEAKMGETEDIIPNDFDRETDKMIEALQSEEFKESFRKQVEEDTWGQGKPMFYTDAEGWLVEHHKDGTINKLKKLK